MSHCGNLADVLKYFY